MVGLLFSLQGCTPFESNLEQTSGVSPSETKLKASAIIDQNCVGCHGRGASLGGFGGIEDTDSLLLRGVIVPGDLTSPLLDSVLNNRMPSSYSLSSTDKNILRDWVMLLTLPEEGETPLACSLVPSKLSVLVDENFTLSLIVIGTVASAFIEGQEINLSESNQLIVNLASARSFSASISNAVESVTCSTPIIQITPPPALTELQFFQSKTGPGNNSVNDLITRSNQCIMCHNPNPPPGRLNARDWFVLLNGSEEEANLNAIKDLNNNGVSIDLTSGSPCTLSLYIGNHHPLGRGPFTNDELNWIDQFCDSY